MEEISDSRFGELVLRAPEQRFERADLDTDATVHTQREVDVEAIESVDLAGLTAGTARRRLLLVTLDIDAPVGALTGAEHARSAVLLVQGDHSAGSGGRRFLLVRVLHGVGALDRVGDRLLGIREDRAEHGAAGDTEALDDSGR